MRNQVEIYSTKKGMIAIESPIKNKILQKLAERELTFEELIEVCGKARSTMSVHLNDLLNMGLVYKRVDSRDHRKKYFGLNTDLLVSSKMPVSAHYDKILQSVPATIGNKYDFLKSLFHLVRSGMESYGVDTSPALKKIGRDVGRVLASHFKAKTASALLKEVSQFWEAQGLGIVRAVKGDVPTIIVDDCFDCSTMPDIGHTQCSMDEGILEAIIEEKLKVKCSVEEVECYGTGHHHCKFLIKIF
ncbi:MAG TPA: V4R domain-containing protein [Methanocella sp.]|uniref:V4R domain-containing protein n=1 Tax=Methanocella sp. TaxID=2052833 RepID=UPI002BA4CE53|nr:V4R domain-containing protein [Methanocella sp.]HTY91480.1 V4R domain-containing protein [Methanocella sp.]